MKLLAYAFVAVLASISTSTSLAEETGSLNPNLEYFRPLLGKTWKGEFPNSTPENPIYDRVSYERILNGQAIRAMHSLNDGMYGGETVFRWDEEKQSVVYHYFTTQGFMTSGTLTLEDGSFTTYETVEGEAGGVSAVRSRGTFSDSEYSTETEYLKEGEWLPGHSSTYHPAPTESVVFK